ncbi:MAG TPA: HIT family protein [Thermoplasmata archaeon]|nr:HIT family protein [Thermoplasmata archaeon]
MPPATAPDRCIFCEIVARRAPAHVVYEDATALAFLDLFPYTRGHLLVVPKRHIDRLLDLPPADRGPFLGAVAEVCRRIERLSAHYNVALNQGSLAGQIVFHLHFHVIPRYDRGNPFGVMDRERLDADDAAAVVALLSPA